MSSSLEREVSRQMKKRRGPEKRRTSRRLAAGDRSAAPGDDAGSNSRGQRSAVDGTRYAARLAPGYPPPRRSSPPVVTVIGSRSTGTFACAWL
jgi:hypothetical protein